MFSLELNMVTMKFNLKKMNTLQDLEVNISDLKYEGIRNYELGQAAATLLHKS